MRSSQSSSGTKYDSNNIEKFQKEVRTLFSVIPSKIRTTLAESPNNGSYRVLNKEHELNLSMVLNGDIPKHLDQDPVTNGAVVRRHDG